MEQTKLQLFMTLVIGVEVEKRSGLVYIPNRLLKELLKFGCTLDANPVGASFRLSGPDGTARSEKAYPSRLSFYLETVMKHFVMTSVRKEFFVPRATLVGGRPPF